MANLKLRSKVTFPANVSGGHGITVTKSGGTYTFAWDISSFGQIASVSDSANQGFAIQNKASGVGNFMSFADLTTAVQASAATVGAYKLYGNPTAGSAALTSFTIDSLTAKASPVSTDEVLLWDVAGSAMKKTTVSAIGTSAGVASFATRTGAVTAQESDYDAFYVRHDSAAQGLSTTDQVNSRTNVAAAPYDAIGYMGVQTNGGMEVSQEVGTQTKTFTGGAVTHTNIVDGWACGYGGTMVVTWQQVTDAPPGYPNSLKMAVTTAEASMASGDVIVLVEGIEGTRLARLAWGTANAQPLAVGFWVKAHRTGTYSGSLKNPAGTRSYVFSYTVNVADTWEWKTVSITGETSGVWVKDTTVGAFFTFCIGCGVTLLAPGTGWNNGNYDGLTGTTNGVAALTDTFQITGVILVPGVQLPDQNRAPFVMRPFHEELRLCNRYWQTSYDYGVSPGSASRPGDSFLGSLTSSANTLLGGTERFAVIMRGDPTVTLYSPVSGLTARAYDIAATADTTGGTATVRDTAGSKGFGWNVAGVSNTNAQYVVHWVADSRYF